MSDAPTPLHPQRGGHKGSRQRLAATERQAQALELRKRGYTFDAIAEELGFAGRQGAYKTIMSALKKLIQEPAEDLLKLELERLDVALNALWPFVLKGSPRHIEIMLKVMDRRSTYLGLDAPKQVEDHRHVTITLMAEQVAEQTGLNKDEILAEAQAIMAAAGGGA